MKTYRPCRICGGEKTTRHCRPCANRRQRARRATAEGRAAVKADNDKRRSDPAVRERQRASWRNRYHTDAAFRDRQLARSRKALATSSDRIRRIHALLDHFEGRPAWTAILVEIIMWRRDGYGIQWLSERIDEACAAHVGDI